MGFASSRGSRKAEKGMRSIVVFYLLVEQCHTYDEGEYDTVVTVHCCINNEYFYYLKMMAVLLATLYYMIVSSW